METLERRTSDISSLLFHIKDDQNNNKNDHLSTDLPVPALSEVEQAKCECCGMSEECTAEYIDELREKYSGRLICGLCAEAVKEEMEKNGGRTREEALEQHMNACVKFNKIGRAYPLLYQADAVKMLLKKSCANGPNSKGSGLARNSSCMPAIAIAIAIAQDMDKLRF